MHNILESSENYLETIYRIKKSKESVRSIDVAKFLNLSKASVSRGLKKLKENGLIIIDIDGKIELSEEGVGIAKSVYEKHLFLKEFFIEIGVSSKVAEEDACKIEHAISDESFQKWKEFLKK